MRKGIVGAMVSMDGVMQAPGGPAEDPTGGFKFGGWTASSADTDPVFGDEIRTFTLPVLLGKGKRLFDESSQPSGLKLTHIAVSPNGLIAAIYVRDGEVRTATVGGAKEPSAAELARREKLKREA